MFSRWLCRCEGGAFPLDTCAARQSGEQSPRRIEDCFVAKNKNAPRNDGNTNKKATALKCAVAKKTQEQAVNGLRAHFEKG